MVGVALLHGAKCWRLPSHIRGLLVPGLLDVQWIPSGRLYITHSTPLSDGDDLLNPYEGSGVGEVGEGVVSQDRVPLTVQEGGLGTYGGGEFREEKNVD